MVPLAALLLEEGHRVTGSDLKLYPPMSTTLERLGIPVADGFAAEHVPADCDVVVVGNAASARQRRGGRGDPPRPACPLPATGGPAVPAAGEDLGRHHGNARQDDDLGPDRLAAARLGSRPGLHRRRARCRTSAAATGAAAARTSCSRATSTTRPSSTAGRSSCTTSRCTSSSATSSTTTPTSTRTFRRSSRRFARSCACVPRDGTVVVNADDPRVMDVAQGCAGAGRPRRRSTIPAPTSRRATSRSARRGRSSRCSKRASRRRGCPRL